jgi:hypothetical protein
VAHALLRAASSLVTTLQPPIYAASETVVHIPNATTTATFPDAARAAIATGTAQPHSTSIHTGQPVHTRARAAATATTSMNM